MIPSRDQHGRYEICQLIKTKKSGHGKGGGTGGPGQIHGDCHWQDKLYEWTADEEKQISEDAEVLAKNETVWTHEREDDESGQGPLQNRDDKRVIEGRSCLFDDLYLSYSQDDLPARCDRVV